MIPPSYIPKHAFSWLLAGMALLSGCGREGPVSSTWTTMGTFASITAAEDDPQCLYIYSEKAKQVFSSLENKLSVFLPKSEISKLNRSAGIAPVPVSPETEEILTLSRRYADITGGCFDPTIAPVIRLWGFGPGPEPVQPPDPAILQAHLDKSGFRHLILSNHTAFLNTQGSEINLGGIAKGYAVDRCFEELRRMGARNIMINLGGNIRCAGHPKSGLLMKAGMALRPWRIGVRNPFQPDDILGVLTLTNGMATATSGNYERFILLNGERYTHIIDPRSGYPVKDMAGVTVISRTAVEADALSTALFVLGMKDSAGTLSRCPESGALFVPDKQPVEIWITPEFKKHFTPAVSFRENIRDLP